jgi:methionine-rich copper-binding protein CopC
MRRLVAAAVATAVLALPGAATAHVGIESYSPKPGSRTSKSLSLVKVTFEARIADAKLTVARGSDTVSRGDGNVVKRKRQVRVRLRSGLRAGRYTATVRWLSGDGHIQTGSWSFRLR